MTWLAIGRWILARIPQILIAAGVVLLLGAAAEWWAGVRAAPLMGEIARLTAEVARHEGEARLASETAVLAVREAEARAAIQHREDSNEIDRLLERESALLAAGDADRADLARRLREQWAAGRAAGRRDREGLPPAGGDRHPAPAAPAPGGLVPGPDHRPDRFDIGADIALTGEQTAAVCRVLYDAAIAGRHIKLTRPQ